MDDNEPMGPDRPTFPEAAAPPVDLTDKNAQRRVARAASKAASVNRLQAGQIPPQARRRKSTKAEHRAKVDMTVIMVCEGRSDADIKRLFKQSYGIKFRQVARYIRLARDRLAKEASRDREDMIAESLGFYKSILTNKNATVKDKLAARKLGDELMGLAAPRKIAPTNPDGTEPYRAAVSNLTDEELRVLTRASERMSEVAAGKKSEASSN